MRLSNLVVQKLPKMQQKTGKKSFVFYIFVAVNSPCYDSGRVNKPSENLRSGEN